MHWVIDFSFISDFKVKLKFEDDTEKVVDLEPHLEGNIFKPLKNPSYFKQATLNKDIDTIVWPNDADFSPDFLYEIGKEI